MKKHSWRCAKTKDGVDHPPVENYESYCSFCKKPRPFVETLKLFLPLVIGSGGIFLAALIFQIFTPKSESVYFIYVVDESASAVNNRKYLEEVDQTCQALRDFADNSKDYISNLVIYSKLDPAVISDPRLANRATLDSICKRKHQFHPGVKNGTFVCPAWDKAFTLLSSSVTKNSRPILITQIETNEKEELCNPILTKLSNVIISREGFHAIASSTNNGHKPFNGNLHEFFRKNVSFDHAAMFFDENPRQCIKSIIESVRYNPQTQKSNIKC